MDEKKKTSGSKNKNSNKTAAPKKKQTTKPAAKNSNSQTKAKQNSQTKPKQNNQTKPKQNSQNKKVAEKKDIKEVTKELYPVINEAKKQNKEKNVKNKPMGETESAKVEKQLKERFKNNDEMSKLFRIVLIVTIIMVVFYGITLLVTNKADKTKVEEKTTNEQPEKSVIQYENIMLGTMLNHSGSYYVLIEQENDNRVAEYDSLVKTIESSDDAPTIYKANLTDSFNKGYLGKEENYYVDNIADFKVTGTTLVKVNNSKVESVFDDYDTIKNKLNDLS